MKRASGWGRAGEAAALVAVLALFSGCQGLQYLRSDRVKGASVESTRRTEKGIGERESAYRRYVFPPLPVYVPQPPAAAALGPASQSAVPAPKPGSGAAAAAPPSAGTKADAPVGWVPGGCVEEWYAYKGPEAETEEASGKSHGADASGPPGSLSLKAGEAPEVNLGKGTASGGTFSFASTLVQVFQGPMILVWIGGVALLVGLILAVGFKMRTLGVGIAVGGGALTGLGLLVGTYPWMLLAGLGVILLAGVGFLVYAWKTGSLKAAFGQVVAGGEAVKAKLAEVLPTDLASKALAAFKSAQNESQDTATQEAVERAKREGP